MSYVWTALFFTGVGYVWATFGSGRHKGKRKKIEKIIKDD